MIIRLLNFVEKSFFCHLHVSKHFYCYFHSGVKQMEKKMARRVALSDNSISKILAEDTVIDLFDDVTIEPILSSENTNKHSWWRPT